MGEESNISNDDQEVKKPIDVSKKARAARAEFIAQLRDVCVHILHSFAGARVTMNSLWHGSAKDRKGDFFSDLILGKIKIQKAIYKVVNRLQISYLFQLS